MNQHKQRRLQELVSLLLIDCGGIQRPRNGPYELSSGNFSPLYFDNRTLSTNPSDSLLITSYMLNVLENIEDEHGSIRGVAGGATAGIAPARDLARMGGKEFIYVRKEKKGYGAESQVEGVVHNGTILLVEDLITEGGSKIRFLNGLEEAGYNVHHCLVIFDREQGGEERLKQKDVQLHALTNLTTTLQVGDEIGFFRERELKQIRDYLDDPESWSARQSS